MDLSFAVAVAVAVGMASSVTVNMAVLESVAMPAIVDSGTQRGAVTVATVRRFGGSGLLVRGCQRARWA